MCLKEKIPNCWRCDFFDSAQTVAASRQNAFDYDECVSGSIIYAYVANNPTNLVDPMGLLAQLSGTAHPEAYWGKTADASDWVHGALGAASFCPSLCGSAFSVVDAGVYAIEGDKLSASISIGAAAAGIITDAGAAKLALTVGKGLVEGANVAKGIAAEGKTVLGHYPEYKQMAESLGARHFNIPEAAWNKMSESQRWTANQKFLDRAINRGDEIILSTPLDKVRPGSYFARELEYMGSKGYVPSADGSRLIRP